MYVFIATLLVAYISLVIIALFSVAKNLWGRPWSPAPSFPQPDKDPDDAGDLDDETDRGQERSEASQAIRAASRDIPLEREYS